ncbi:Glycosyltransferase involved in cell wall bisynthesis [Flavobacterium fryxellicola]|uniref:Glycosyl transferase n=1 Tax=Flavobacterium fryxellicola TaxID=249352 RepID=A0A167WZ80_9FLAO|nr:glycosyltransferase family 2 protein [Flavobacterium fryxellicola]OAB27876.1 glycosyl transferase [Flavobacterium fryxellicola]SHN66050.1 Glycosyltransferase involved in cell wall bisynthesis [Flavobacterium fryxellicola]
MSTKISIITINRNNLEGLKTTIESVVKQTWSAFEYIVIDGGSTDGSKAYIEAQSENIDYWISEPDKGIYNAMNKGILKASGDYLLFLNSGDHFDSYTVLQENHNQVTNYDLIYFNLKVIGDNNVFLKKYPDQLSFSYFTNDTLPHPATFIKASLFTKIGMYDESFKIVSDWKFFMEGVCKFNCSYVRVDETLTTFYMDGISSDPHNKVLIFEESQKILKSNFPAFICDNEKLFELKTIVDNLRKSRKVKVLVKLGILNKF